MKIEMPDIKDWILQPWLAFSYANINDTRFIHICQYSIVNSHM